ncbi:receptor-like serine/threonine-protein kinase SD1-8 isoform X1 [Typha latifolia]|uniref:receptor-like serine/threonine-protein kinase SD1-8 isoform X1 n=2 Tax=Typha latifolia TaxID=4733 RepID=UPI003C2DC4F1
MTSLHLLFLLLSLAFAIHSSPSVASDSITLTTRITADGERLVSSGGKFALGFFKPAGNSLHTYLGIWYDNIPTQTVVWVANRNNPLTNTTGILKMADNGSLVVTDRFEHIFWSSGSAYLSNPVAQLLDSGNFVLRNGSSNAIAWQSFDYPTDTLLSGMKLGWNLKTGLDRYINSWLSFDDPSQGAYSFRMDPHGAPELFLYRWSTKTYASGLWNGVQFSGVPELKSTDNLTFSFVSNQDEIYYTYEVSSSMISRFVMNSTGSLQRFIWFDTTQSWSLFWSDPKDPCDSFGACGPFGICNMDTSPMCSCVHGFDPKSPQDWNLRATSGGCVRKTKLDCKGDEFLEMDNVKPPESINAIVNMSMGIDECRQSCLMNCSCRAYASANISGGESGCIIWATDLIDMRQFDAGGQTLYVRLAASDMPIVSRSSSGNGNSDKKKIIIITATISAVLLVGFAGCCIWMKKVKRRKEMNSFPPRIVQRHASFNVTNQINSGPTLEQLSDDDISTHKDLELPLLDLATVLAATNNFALDNKLGEGGFGPVYMGKLDDGQDVAVKRLSRRSTQGVEEFKNEVKLIAKLQHRNLVRLLGCCIHGEEKMLVYEYMHNRSLNTFIFDEEKRALLNWQKRFSIILGIARGLVYLHQDSRFRIIHRDLKASNVLLDGDMNAKISDFGVARIFGGDQTDAYTRKVVGTYGYMSPEYAMDGIFSMKSDVFSFGVLVLEIVSGKRNRGFYHTDLDLNLLRYAWRLWKEGKSLEFVDVSVGSSYDIPEVLRCIQIGLLCVQEQPRQRPIMSAVTMMLASENASLPEPSEPGFGTGRNTSDTELSHSYSANNVTVTMIEGR